MRLALMSFLLMFMTALPSQAADRSGFDYESFKQIPILHEGRVKPMESFARAYLLAFSNKTSVEGLSAIEWLAELLFDQEQAYERKVFNIANPDVLHAVGLDWREGHRYSFNEASSAVDQHNDTIAAIYNMEDGERTLPQQQLLTLYFKVVTLAEISHSLTLIQPRFSITNTELAEELKVKPNIDLTYLDLMAQEESLIKSAGTLQQIAPSDLSEKGREHLDLALTMMVFSQHKQAIVFRIMPPQWDADGEVWLSPWANILQGRGSPKSAEYLRSWAPLAGAYAKGDAGEWQEHSQIVYEKAYDMAGEHASTDKQELEVLYHKANFFQISLGLYLVSFLLILGFLFSGSPILYKAPFALLILASIVQTAGIIMRIVIMDRPPVSTLYETTIFVSLIAVILSLIFESKRKDGTGLLTAAIIGSVLLFVSMRYASDGDTMEMLVAVLDTNFWLATHVVTITMGYGCALVAGTLAHIYLFQRILAPANTSAHSGTIKTMLAVGLIALFFSLLGTILGGIWADQSWGRFWGWDPKENGAMWIVLWLLFCLHGRISGVLSPLNFASLMIVTNIIVALAWFGVNLLSVGLHSYGFTDSIAGNLALFCSVELAFIAIMRIILMRQNTKEAKP